MDGVISRRGVSVPPFLAAFVNSYHNVFLNAISHTCAFYHRAQIIGCTVYVFPFAFFSKTLLGRSATRRVNYAFPSLAPRLNTFARTFN